MACTASGKLQNTAVEFHLLSGQSSSVSGRHSRNYGKITNVLAFFVQIRGLKLPFYAGMLKFLSRYWTEKENPNQFNFVKRSIVVFFCVVWACGFVKAQPVVTSYDYYTAPTNTVLN